MAETQIHVVTGPVHSGKTTWLTQFCKTHENVHGILTPVINNTRYFKDARTNEEFRMEVVADEESMLIGKYRFSRQAFDKAGAIIENAPRSPGSWLVVDEIGPLELNRQGFYTAVQKLLNEAGEGNLIIVVREHLLEDIFASFGISNYQVLHNSNHAS